MPILSLRCSRERDPHKTEIRIKLQSNLFRSTKNKQQTFSFEAASISRGQTETLPCTWTGFLSGLHAVTDRKASWTNSPRDLHEQHGEDRCCCCGAEQAFADCAGG